MTWSAEDIRVASVLEAQFPNVRVVDVIHHEEIRMTDTTTPVPELNTGDDNGWAEATEANVTFPEIPSNPHNHVYTWSPKLPDGSMLVIRSSTAQGLVEATESMAPHAARLKAAWGMIVGQPAPQAPAFQGAAQGANFNPQMPPANQPFQGQPAWQQAGAPQGGFQAPASPVPPGWFKLNVPFKDKPAFDAIVAQYGFRKGDPGGGGQVSFQKAVKSWFCAGEIAQAFAQFSPVPA